MYDAADDAPIIRPLNGPYIRWQTRFDPLPLPITQPEQVPAHAPNPLPKTKQDRIVRTEELMNSESSHQARWVKESYEPDADGL
jgi:hypothetical protein